VKRGRGGFTLLEVLLTLGILASILAMIYGVLYATLLARKKVDDAAGKQKLVPALFKVLEEDFSTAFLPVPDGKFFVGQDKFYGSTAVDRVDFLAARSSFDPETQNVSDLTEVGYQLKQNPDHTEWYRLLRREDASLDDDPLAGGTLTQLHDKVVAFDIQYFDGKDWVKEWDSKEKKGLPQGVKVEIELHPEIDEIPEDELTDKEPVRETLYVALPK